MKTVKNLVLCVLMLVLVSTAAGVTINVPVDYGSIQEAIIAAASGDEIEVAPDTYYEAINFNGKAIHLYSSTGNPADTVINGNGANHVVQCVSGEGTGTILEGFTITGGNAVNGGGMYNSGSSPTVTNCIFVNNSATGGLVTTWEPGLWYGTLPGNINTTGPNPQTSVTLDLRETEDTYLPENTTEVYTGQIWVDFSGVTGFTEHNDDKTRLYIDLNQDGDFGDPGELVLSSDDWLDRVEGYVALIEGQWYGFELRMSNGDGLGGLVEAPCFGYQPPGGDWVHPEDPGDGSLFRHEVTTAVESKGGGMYNDSSSPTVTGCTFESNSAQQAGGMYNDDGSNPTISDCDFTGNSAEGAGGGMRNVESDPILTNCIFIENSAVDSAGLSSIRSNPTLANCSFINNRAAWGGGGMGTRNGEPLLTNCTFTGNSASDHGGGMHNYLSSPTLTNCTFNANTAKYGGGVHYEETDDAILTNCTFTGNSASYNGGGMYNNSSNPTVTDCEFSGNQASSDSGGMHNDNGSNPTVTGCTFSNNTAAGSGGGMHNWGSSPTVTDCTFSENSADDKGGGMYNQESSPSVDNCSFSGNTTYDGAGMYNLDSSPTVTNCTFSNNSASHNGSGMMNKGSSPTVNNCSFSGNSAGDRGGGMHNFNGSNPTVTGCAFSNNTAWGSGGGMRNDFSSNPSITNCSFSGNSADGGGGMYNAESSPTVTNCSFSGNQAKYGGGMRNDFSSNPSITNCSFSGNSADGGGGMLNLSFSNTIVTNCILWGNTPNEIENGDDTSPTTVTYSDVQGGWPGPTNINADPLFVDATAGDLRLASSGSPCVDEGNNDAVTDANDLDGNPRIVDGDLNGDAVVDMGAYEFQPGPIHNITQDLWYETIQSAIDYSNDYDQIEVAAGTYYEAIDFLGMAIHLCSIGGPEVTIIDGGGAYHVVQCVSGEGSDTILQGFTITGGNADSESWPNERGAGMYNQGTSPTVTNCIFTGNTATDYGGGMSNNASSPTVTGCSFEDNSANHFGGMHNGGSNPTVTDCTFTGNTAGSNGGGMGNTNSSPDVINCTFSGNSANSGGGMSNIESSPNVTNCSFISNVADAGGGGIDNYYSDAILTNCTFIENSAAFGGAVWNPESSPSITNCILWADTPDEIAGGTPTVTYSDVQGGWDGTDNIGADPMFADADGRLLSGSPCIEAGSNGAVPGDIETDLDGNLRIADGDLDGDPVVDMGAYEYVWTDADEDGIEDSVDTAPGVYSDDFDDGTTGGTILDRADQNVFVSNAQDPCGVRISASGGATLAQVSVCGMAAFTLDAGMQLLPPAAASR